MLIDVSYFTKGSRRIQNASVSGTKGSDSMAVSTAIDGYVSELQPVFLRSMLGEDEAGHVEDYLELVAEGDDFGSESKYTEICERLKEPLADYVMFHILRDSCIQKTVVGTVRLKNANTAVNPMRAQVDAWNRMVSGNLRFLKWAQDGKCPVDIVTETNMLNRINQFNL